MNIIGIIGAMEEDKACALVAVASCSIVQVRNGPPEAVSITFSTGLPISSG